jgi:hypothetical protein
VLRSELRAPRPPQPKASASVVTSVAHLVEEPAAGPPSEDRDGERDEPGREEPARDTWSGILA